jgi:hypothetical protein
MPESKAKATLSYSFGDIRLKVSTDGNIDSTIHVENHVLDAMLVSTGGVVEKHGISERKLEEGSVSQTCSTTVEFGEIRLNLEMEFSLNQQLSKRTLNTIVFGVVLPEAIMKAAEFFGDSNMLTQRSHRELMQDINALTSSGSKFSAYDTATDSSLQSSDQASRSRSLVGAH